MAKWQTRSIFNRKHLCNNLLSTEASLPRGLNERGKLAPEARKFLRNFRLKSVAGIRSSRDPRYGNLVRRHRHDVVAQSYLKGRQWLSGRRVEPVDLIIIRTEEFND